MEPGNIKGEICGRDGCSGIIDEREAERGCSCHINPPCSYCTTSREYCPVCGWDGREEQQEAESIKLYKITAKRMSQWEQERKKWNDAFERFQAMYNGQWPITELIIRQQNHTHFSQYQRGVFPPGTETRETILPKVRGTFGGRFTHFGDYSFEYIAYTD